MADLLLDTTLFADYQLGDPKARDVVSRVLDGAITASYCPLTLAELWQESSFGRREEIAYTALIGFLEEAALTSESAKVAGSWLRPLAQEEREAYSAYAILAAVAQERGETICTRDPERYLRFYSNVTSY